MSQGCGGDCVIGASWCLSCLCFPLALCAGLKQVQEYERAVIFRLGRLQNGSAGPGLFCLLPCTDTFVRVRTSSLHVIDSTDCVILRSICEPSVLTFLHKKSSPKIVSQSPSMPLSTFALPIQQHRFKMSKMRNTQRVSLHRRRCEQCWARVH